jgi:hypothetical protein
LSALGPAPFIRGAGSWQLAPLNLMKRQRASKSFGQCIAEYVILFFTVSAAVLFLVYYMQAGIRRAIGVAADQAGNQEDAVKYFETGDVDTDYIQPRASDFWQQRREQTGGRQIIDFQGDTYSFIEDGKSVAKEVID